MVEEMLEAALARLEGRGHGTAWDWTALAAGDGPQAARTLHARDPTSR
jgi:hypothetical protein